MAAADVNRRRACGVALLRSALDAETPAHEPSRATRRLIGRTKEFVEEKLSDPIRLSDVASSVGASPAYLTDVFRRFEGLPLHRYVLQARLARALVELPHAGLRGTREGFASA